MARISDGLPFYHVLRRVELQGGKRIMGSSWQESSTDAIQMSVK